MLPASGEVDRILHVPLVDLLRPDTYREERWGRPPLDRTIHFFELDDETVWGATAGCSCSCWPSGRVWRTVIEAGAYTLRPWHGDDTAFVFDACQDPDVPRWTTVPSPYRGADAALFVDAHACRQPEASSAWFAMTITDTGELLGSISFNVFDQVAGAGDIGYWLAWEARGAGVATTCLDGLVCWGFGQLGLTRCGRSSPRATSDRSASPSGPGSRRSDHAGPVPRRRPPRRRDRLRPPLRLMG